MTTRRYQAVVVGLSAGGLRALRVILPGIPAAFPIPVILVQHLHPLQDGSLFEQLRQVCPITIREAEEKEPILPGVIYHAPANYHLLIESDRTFSLSVDPRVNFSRPSIDVLFETAAEAYGADLIGIILTGASRDGAAGLQRVKQAGGLTVVQDPGEAEFPTMPSSAIAATEVDHVLNLNDIARFLVNVGKVPAGDIDAGKTQDG